PRQPLVLAKAHHVSAGATRDFRGAVRAPVVDHHHLDRIDTGNLLRQVGERDRQCRLLVEAGDLDDELHAERQGGYSGLESVAGPASESSSNAPCSSGSGSSMGEKLRPESLRRQISSRFLSTSRSKSAVSSRGGRLLHRFSKT